MLVLLRLAKAIITKLDNNGALLIDKDNYEYIATVSRNLTRVFENFKKVYRSIYGITSLKNPPIVRSYFISLPYYYYFANLLL